MANDFVIYRVFLNTSSIFGGQTQNRIRMLFHLGKHGWWTGLLAPTVTGFISNQLFRMGCDENYGVRNPFCYSYVPSTHIGAAVTVWEMPAMSKKVQLSINLNTTVISQNFKHSNTSLSMYRNNVMSLFH